MPYKASRSFTLNFIFQYSGGRGGGGLGVGRVGPMGGRFTGNIGLTGPITALAIGSGDLGICSASSSSTGLGV